MIVMSKLEEISFTSNPNGKPFFTPLTFKRNEPTEFPVGGVIPGWTEALKLMKEGDEWELTIPSDLAYGAQGNQSIPPNSVLQFKVHLLKVL